MLYDINLTLGYDYGYPVSGAKHLLRVLPDMLNGIQRVQAASVRISPQPTEREDGRDFFNNRTVALSLREAHEELEITMQARVEVQRQTTTLDLSPLLSGLEAEIGSIRSLGFDTPHHFRHETARLRQVEAIANYAHASASRTQTVRAVVQELGYRIHEDFAYDPDATLVDTSIAEAFALKRGVCQDFAHIMIAACHALGIPAGYVSGFIRTVPPEGEERLEGADAMHAWMRAWCGREAGWIEFDPTNAMLASDDHIVVAYGRDYGDVSPVVGVLQAGARHRIRQSVDVRPLS